MISNDAYFSLVIPILGVSFTRIGYNKTCTDKDLVHLLVKLCWLLMIIFGNYDFGLLLHLGSYHMCELVLQ